MEERASGSTSNSRKRHRSDERSGSSFKLTTPPAAAVEREARMRGTENGTVPSEALLSSVCENPTPILQPLHPPIPHFSAISQGAPRPNTISPTNNESPGGVIYNIALPLPNPGRAHRFCQACDHINHVRRKLCENCGAPKPSAVRNAVGVRSVNDVETSSDRRPRQHVSYGFEGGTQRNSGKQYTNMSGNEQHGQYASTHLQGNDQKASKIGEPVIHQAHSLAMRCPGDDIPLLGQIPRGSASYQMHDSQSSQRIRTGQNLLSEPLISFGPVPTQDPKQAKLSSRQNFSGAMDFSQKVFPGYPTDRDQPALPSMNGVSNHHVMQPTTLGMAPVSRPQAFDAPVAQNALNFPHKQQECSLPDEVIHLSRHNVIHELDARQAGARYQILPLARTGRNDSGQPFPEALDGQGSTAYTYPPNPDIFSHPQQLHSEERMTSMREDRKLRKYGEGLKPIGDAEKGFPIGHGDSQIGTRANLNLGRLMEHHAENSMRPVDGRGHGGQIGVVGRADLMQVGQIHRVADQNPGSHFEDSNRAGDDGRFAIENILMQHKSEGNN